MFLKIYWCDRFSCCHVRWFMHFRHWSLNTSNGWFLVVTAFTCVSLSQSDINLAWPLSFHRCETIHFHYLLFLHLPHCFLMISNWAWQVYSYLTSLIYSRAKLSFNITTSANCKSTKNNPAVLLCWKKTVDAYIYISPGFSNEFTQGLECFLNACSALSLLACIFFCQETFQLEGVWLSRVITNCLPSYSFV